MALQKAIAVSMVSWLVCRPVIISTPFCTGTGFMKCVEMTREEADVSVGPLVVAAAILVIEMEEVFVARMACGGHICARELNMSNLREGISGTASMTKSTFERESKDVVGERRDRMESACSCVIRSFETSFVNSFSVFTSQHGL